MVLSRRRGRDPEGRMSLSSHFKEFRNRLIVAVLAIVVCAVVGWIYYEEIIKVILDPVSDVRTDAGDPLIIPNFAQTITQPFGLQLRVSFFVGIVLSSPVWIWQIWAFMLPGLRKRERRLAIWFFVASVPLFFTGAALASWALPRTAAILLSFLPPTAGGVLNAVDWLNFVLYFVVAFGIAFLLPVFMVGLNSIGLFPVKAMRSGWRFALLGILIFSAMATPDPELTTMFALALPMFGLYWCAVGIAAFNERRRRKNDPEWMSTADDEASPL
ncbi:MAG: twin-arginine translocase subunit TatC [Ornithinimicrobium sp.]